MGSQKCLILHINEWERIKRLRKSHKEPINDDGHIKRMRDLSQEWIRSWPDTTKGHIELLKKIEVKKRKKDLEEIKRFASQKKKDGSAEAIQKARQLLFEDSCYGKQLISCLIESKTLEERDAQIEFKMKVKERTDAEKKETLLKQEQRNRELEDIENNRLRQKRKKDRETAEINKAMYEVQNMKRIRDKEIEKQQQLDDMEIIINILENETKCRIKDKVDTNKQVHQENVKYYQYKKHLEQNRTREQEKNERVNQVWHEYDDRVRRKKKLAYQKTKKKDTLKKMQLFQKLEEKKKIEESRYDDFVDKGIKRLEKRLLNEENKHTEKNQRNKPCSMKTKNEAQNKTQEKKQHDGESAQNIPRVCHCDRQTLVCKSTKKYCNNNGADIKKEKSLQFLGHFYLEPSLKKREKDPFTWSGMKAAHEQFAEQAGKILGECRFKTMARRVVDEYRKIHCLDANNLPIQNYL